MNASNSASRCTHESGNKRVWRGNGSTLDEITFWSVNGQKLATYKPVNLGGSSVYFSLTGTDVYFGSRLIAKGTPNGGTNADYVTLASVATDRLGSIGKFYPFGQERPSATANDTEKFTGYYRDAATGLDYADQRYHQPGMGRFMTADQYQASAGPSNPGSWNRYASVSGDPINHADPTGLAACDPDDPTCESMCLLCDVPSPTGGIVCAGGGVVLSMTSATNIICSQPVFLGGPAGRKKPPTPVCEGSYVSQTGVYYDCLHQSGNDWRALTTTLGKLEKKLSKDQDCMNLLTSGGTSASTVMGILSDPSISFVLANFIQGPQGNDYAGTTEDLNPPQAPIAISSTDFMQGNQATNFLTILHELAHLTAVFGAETIAGNPTSAQNDLTIETDCSKTLGLTF